MKVSEIEVTYSNKNTDKVKITQSKDAYEVAIQHWNLNTIELQEEAKVILLNRANVVIGIYNLSKGGVSGCIVDIKLILSVSLKAVASGIILIHNHPSTALKPSTQDTKITDNLKAACQLVDIMLLDHLIINPTMYYSMADNGDI
ncbi:DNA repair protein [Neptunitalea chrysea]|uniref:DNA repair protein n=1 Tax=Neptunitalea chrysea TaxID=1647581 RepID=A0A9W6B8G4_9FLAO|nr:JAB domain-containing protein [Neptunitalea chrysea]GLB52783.1 DNA repair protein [Neptunitalea chrysea]